MKLLSASIIFFLLSSWQIHQHPWKKLNHISQNQHSPKGTITPRHTAHHPKTNNIIAHSTKMPNALVSAFWSNHSTACKYNLDCSEMIVISSIIQHGTILGIIISESSWSVIWLQLELTLPDHKLSVSKTPIIHLLNFKVFSVSPRLHITINLFLS